MNTLEQLSEDKQIMQNSINEIALAFIKKYPQVDLSIESIIEEFESGNSFFHGVEINIKLK